MLPVKKRSSGSLRSRLGATPKAPPIQTPIERLPTFGPDCLKCHAVTVQRDSKYGSFWGCRNYPRCKGTLPLE